MALKSFSIFRKLLFFSLLLFLFSCLEVDNNSYTNERIEIVKDISFDQNIISNIQNFDSIENYLRKNMSTIFENNEVKISYKKNKEGDKFFFNGKNVSQLPSKMLHLESILQDLGEKEYFQSVKFSKDSSIIVVIRSTYNTQYLSNVNEILYKNKENKSRLKKGTLIGKDTIVNGWKYQIKIDRKYGW